MSDEEKPPTPPEETADEPATADAAAPPEAVAGDDDDSASSSAPGTPTASRPDKNGKKKTSKFKSLFQRKKSSTLKRKEDSKRNSVGDGEQAPLATESAATNDAAEANDSAVPQRMEPPPKQDVVIVVGTRGIAKLLVSPAEPISAFREAVNEAQLPGVTPNFLFMDPEGEEIPRDTEDDLRCADVMVTARVGDLICRLIVPEPTAEELEAERQRLLGPNITRVGPAELEGIAYEAAIEEMWTLGRSLPPSIIEEIGTKCRELVNNVEKMRAECKWDPAEDEAAAKAAGGAGDGDGDGEAAREVAPVTDDDYSAPKLRKLVEAEIQSIKEAFEKSEPMYPERDYHAVVHDEMGAQQVMQDKFQICEDLNELCGVKHVAPTYYYAVFDGHNGRHAAEYCRAHLHVNLAKSELYESSLKKAVADAFRRTDEAYRRIAERDNLNDGTTATVLTIRGNKCYVHWVGDSDAVLCRRSRHMSLVTPHNFQHETEQARVEAAGGKVTWQKHFMINEINLATNYSLTRTIGDRRLADAGVVAEPDQKTLKQTEEDYFVVLGTRGLWSVIKPDEATQITIHWVNAADRNPDDICRALVGETIRRRTTENITCLIVFFTKNGLPVIRPVRSGIPLVPMRDAPRPPREVVEGMKAAFEQWKASK